MTQFTMKSHCQIRADPRKCDKARVRLLGRPWIFRTAIYRDMKRKTESRR